MATNLTVRDPFHEIRGRVFRAFDDSLPAWFEDFPGLNGNGLHARPIRSQLIPLDVYESEKGLTVEAPLPGFDKDQVHVTLEKGTLTIRAEQSAEREDEKHEQGRTYFLRERSRGVSSRSVLVGDSYDPDSVRGSLKDGLLTISVKKLPEAQPKHVEISAG